MRRTVGASASWLYGRFLAVPVTAGMLLATAMSGGAPAVADPGAPDQVATLVAAVANADQKLQELGAAIQTQQEAVNKAIVDVQDARDAAAAAQQEVDASQQGIADANNAIAQAQKRFDTFAAATYVNGPSGSYLTASDPTDIVSTAATGQTLAVSSDKVIADLQRARTEQVNRESAARLAKQNADQATANAQTSQDKAVEALQQAQQTFSSQQDELARLTAERASAQAQLAQVHKTSAATAPAQGQAPQAAADNWDRDPKAPVQAGQKWDGEWDPTLPAIPSAFVSGDPIAIINTVLGISSTSAQVTQNMGRQFLQKLGILPTPTGYTNGAIPRVYGRQASEYVIQRAGSQMGVPYSWGGGNAAGPSRGIDSGANTVGFDCSGLILYAFAGVGIKLPHYSGSQYNAGRKIPSSQMRRGDVIFYGPGGSQHVTLYLGNGQMLEAPYTGSHVKISPVRTSGMTPYVVRYIEY
ncbi:NlpC/P60 family peptidoglycan endopeptidase RipA [Mycolicibacterium fortuitum]|uniref:NlpC/P60 family peptidoglycan endopeptidase RipA n=1 Tax=Mycolicibacterium fortuitum TaxID=1766 RepID=UPI0007EFEE9A|nr:NlpC/P60 family peptidoglycan endopeptidase RipA [Mycolicibacterium fortuitum]MCA4724243.1 NlpC/P60 family peptidoglycan endopeptidase RipA [Mycolicibacterium fortuitum]MDG5769045.1 NlpC/P60 family peptidoglycan endopeptidase RipA [Mycolicibacterium fortuitum]MDG5779469.1 NlpC/P60 family peptidoglycan endopeptidase RipA [Mycolicibacterium fortuitum]NOQ57086.1 NlpC/P60 family peptidoglycan endopeptidase RipA [Mycolicibacterium fortuitum]OBK62083.1 peptidase M23 [Mycolicibacterium fortuitum]